MDFLQTRVKFLASILGVSLVGMTTAETLADGPPSSEPGYLLPSENSVVSFAIALDRELAQDFIRKKSWRPHCDNRKAVARKLYTIGDRLVDQLRLEGYEAVNVDLNNNYRPGENAADVTEMTEAHHLS